MVMIYFCRKMFLTGFDNKLSRQKFRTYRIVKQLGSNAYLLDLPDVVPTSLVFNVSELYKYHGKLPISDGVALPFMDATRCEDIMFEDLVDIGVMGTMLHPDA